MMTYRFPENLFFGAFLYAINPYPIHCLLSKEPSVIFLFTNVLSKNPNVFNFIGLSIPLSRTAGCIYFTCDVLKIAINKTDITIKCSISEVTINKCYKKLESVQDKLIPKAILDKYQ